MVGVIALVASRRLPESPRWLIEHGRLDRAEEVVSGLEVRASNAVESAVQAAGGAPAYTYSFCFADRGLTVAQRTDAEKDGPVGYGKRGSYEGFCSGGGILQLTGGVSAREAVLRADAGDAEMRSALQVSAEYMGACFAMLIDLLNPERIVVGSIYARAERHFRDTAQRVIDAETLPLSRAVCRVVPAQLGDAIGDYAALSVGIDGLANQKQAEKN